MSDKHFYSRRRHAMQLKAGTYAFELDYFKGPQAGLELVFEWSGPGFAKQGVQVEAFSHE